MREDLINILNQAKDSMPRELMDTIDQSTAGASCVMKFLSMADGPVTAGTISRHMKVSTARVAVLLRNMEEKGLILKYKDPSDSRRTLVELSEQGKVIGKKQEDQILKLIGLVVDDLGLDKIQEFLKIGTEIKDSVCQILKNCPDLFEEMG